jgi:hypothetical protein
VEYVADSPIRGSADAFGSEPCSARGWWKLISPRLHYNVEGCIKAFREFDGLDGGIEDRDRANEAQFLIASHLLGREDSLSRDRHPLISWLMGEDLMKQTADH